MKPVVIFPSSCCPTPRVPRTISRSRCVTQRRRRRNNLFKCAIFGQDPNWGRVLAAIGTTSASFEPDRIDVAFNSVQVCRDGSIGDPRELVDLSRHDVQVEVDLHNGGHSAAIWTNDLTYDYVKENAEYST